MSDGKSTGLRIYCLCGQKMKVSTAMLGKPGKCVACRQKIRIPTLDEFPDESNVIHLKDHPEFLRQPKRDSTPAVEASPDSTSDIEGEVVLEGDTGELAAIPFVLFEPLGELCSYEHAVNEQLQALRENKPAQFDKATLMSYRGLARKSRQRLERQIREELISIASEQQRNRDAVAADLLALRTGELPYVEYGKQVLPRRKRREVLASRQHNLRGWLATEDPHMAGGLSEVRLSDVPVEHAVEPFPLETELHDLPIEHAVLKLEEYLREREKADKRLNELHRMKLDGAISEGDLVRVRADGEAARERARSGVAFYRARLQQIIQDCEDDSSALKAFQDVKKRELASGTLTKQAYETIEEDIFRAQVDVKRARNMATRALNANAVSDVPNPRGTFLDRLARPGSYRGIGIDSWMAWVGSAIMLAVIFVPLSSKAPGGNSAVFQGFVLGLFGLAATFGLCATIIARIPRAIAINALWLLITVAGAAYFEYETNTISLAGTALRMGEPWWTSLGGKLLIAGWSVSALSALVASITMPSTRWLGPANLIAGAIVVALILSNYAGFARPRPVLATLTKEVDANGSGYNVVIPFLNTGRRAFWIGGDRAGVPAPARLLVERQIGPTSWQETGQPVEVTVDGAAAILDRKRGLAVPGGAMASLRYGLPPGTYRIELAPQWPGGESVRQEFALESHEVDLNKFFSKPEGAQNDDAGKEPAGTGVTVELRGVVEFQGREPKFSVEVTLPDGTVRREQHVLGDVLYEDWKISEYSPAHNTITVSNGDRLIVISRGKPEELR